MIVDQAKAKVKKKVLGFIIANFLPILFIIIIFSVVLDSAYTLGNWINNSSQDGESLENISWIDNISQDVLDSSGVSRKELKKIAEGEINSYLSKEYTFKITYETDVYEPKLDHDGNIIFNQDGQVEEWIYVETKEHEIPYKYDMSDYTYEYRTPWQLIYAVSLVASMENDTIDDSILEDEDDLLENTNTYDGINISMRTIKKVIKAFDTKYDAIYDYYGDGITVYSSSMLQSLPHTKTSDYYVPQTVFRKIETVFYDYNFSNERNPSDYNNYVQNGITVIPRKDRFIQCLEMVGCDESYVELLVEILQLLGGCDDIITSIYNVMEIDSTNNNGGNNNGNIVDIGNIQLTEITKYALQFVGNKYVYGGTSLTNGIDCSAFVQAIYRKFGVNLPRTSREQVFSGSNVSNLSQALPGDLIFYATNGVVHHVAMYLGDNKIVHASNSKPYPAGGIKVTNNAQYNPIYKIRRVAQ